MNQQLHDYLLDRAWDLTEEWYESLDKNDPNGVFSSEDPLIIEAYKKANYEYHLTICKVFVEKEAEFINSIKRWVYPVVQNQDFLNTPLHYVLREFFRAQGQYLDFIKTFFLSHDGKYSKLEIDSWNRTIIKAFDTVILEYVEANHKYSEHKLQMQQEVIMELSAPIILLNNNTALLPIVGDVDTLRAKFMLENTLVQCSEKGITDLYIDLSGVVIIDTMVAYQIFQMIDALFLIGVNSTLSGIRPEIAQTAVQLDLSFDKITITSTLDKAINSKAMVVTER
jgi:rsbT co-antagonist protein RsbR